MSGISYRARLIVVFAVTAITLAMVNFEIAGKERILDGGTTILLRIAPRDPRSLLQGDYMALRYSMADQIADAIPGADSRDGTAVVQLDADGVATFVALNEGQALATGQHLLRYRKRGESVRIGSDAFFFEEGTWQVYSRARYGEIKVDADGDSVLVGLRGDDLAVLGSDRQSGG